MKKAEKNNENQKKYIIITAALLLIFGITVSYAWLRISVGPANSVNKIKAGSIELILEEDVNTSEESIDIISSSNLLSTLIKGEWDSIEMYNSILLTFQNENNEELANIFI